MTEEMFDIITESSGRGLALAFNRMDFLQLVQVICNNMDSDPKRACQQYQMKGDIVKVADRVLAQALMIPLDYIPIDNRKDYDSSGPMYEFALAFCEYNYGVADGTIDGSNWGYEEYTRNANSFDVNLKKYLQYASNLSEIGG